MNKTTEALKLAEEALEELHYSSGTVKAVTLYKSALAAIREVLADSKPAPDGRIPKTVFTLDDISKAAEIGRQAGIIDALAEPVKQEPVAWVNTRYNMAFVPPEGFNVYECDAYKAGELKPAFFSEEMQPVKQEPVAWVDAKEEGYEFYGISCLPVGKHQLYAAPVDAKAIRSEALEEAAKWFEDEEHPLQPKKVAAAIRGLK